MRDDTFPRLQPETDGALESVTRIDELDRAGEPVRTWAFTLQDYNEDEHSSPLQHSGHDMKRRKPLNPALILGEG